MPKPPSNEHNPARIERGEANPTWTTVTEIARGLGVSVAALAAAVEEAR